jgi:hypothetical protein
MSSNFSLLPSHVCQFHRVSKVAPIFVLESEMFFPLLLYEAMKKIGLGVAERVNRSADFSLTELSLSYTRRTEEAEVEELVCARVDQLRANFSRIVAVSTSNW